MNLIRTAEFNGYPVLSKGGELIEYILKGNEEVVYQALNNHSRVVVMRFELKFPVGYMGSTEVISKFFDALRYRINSDLAKKTESRCRTVNSQIGYVWVKELSGNHGWHYHVALLLNYDVYNCFGIINSTNENMYNRILASWASAIGYLSDDIKGMVHIPNNPTYKLERNSEHIQLNVHAVFHRLSYLAKLKTKPYQSGVRTRFYGTSQR